MIVGSFSPGMVAVYLGNLFRLYVVYFTKIETGIRVSQLFILSYSSQEANEVTLRKDD